jgi:transposase
VALRTLSTHARLSLAAKATLGAWRTPTHAPAAAQDQLLELYRLLERAEDLVRCSIAIGAKTFTTETFSSPVFALFVLVDATFY